MRPGECIAECPAVAERRREDLVELQESERIRERRAGQFHGPLAVRVRRALGCGHRSEVAAPGCEGERRAGDGASARELDLDGRNEEARELRGPVDAEACDLVADAGVLESP